MKRYIFLLLPFIGIGRISAQDIYKAEALTTSDLNGTARYIGMGGAMSALGADLSTMGSNPAGIGLYRHNDIAMTLSSTSQPNAESFSGIEKSRLSFDQFGFVIPTYFGFSGVSFFNIGFNYHKYRNFKNFFELNQISLPHGISQSMEMANMASIYGTGTYDNGQEEFVSPLAEVGWRTSMIDPVKETDPSTGKVTTRYNPSNAANYSYKKVLYGGIQQYDFSLATNYKDRLYWGMDIGLYNVNYNSFLNYSEGLTDGSNSSMTHKYWMTNEESIGGMGVDVKMGVIYRPIEDNPLRVGLSISTPIWYNLTANNSLYMNSPYKSKDDKGNEIDHTEGGLNTGDFRYLLSTPWKFNISCATTIGRRIAIGAEYEWQDYSGSSIRYSPNGYDDSSAWDYATTDPALKQQINQYLSSVSTLRIGAEARLSKRFTLRAGYNYVSPAFKKNAFLNLFPNFGTSYDDSPSVRNATGTDYANLGAISRYCLGVGYQHKNFYIDLAYQFQQQNADVYAFQVPTNNVNYATDQLAPQKTSLNRNNLSLTMGVRF